MNPHDLDADIAATPFLLHLSGAHVSLLARCANRTHFEKGQVVFQLGETANRFYVIQSGIVQLEAPGKDGVPVAVDTIGAGGLLGWSWMFEPYEWQFTARALSETKAIFFYATVLREHCETDPSLGYELFKRMSEVMMKRLQATRALLIAAKSGYSPVGAEHPMRGAA